MLLKQRLIGKSIFADLCHTAQENFYRGCDSKNCWLGGGLRWQTVNPVTNVVMICGGTGSPTVFSLYSSPKEGSTELRLALHLRDRWAVIFIVFWCRSFCLSHWWKVATECIWERLTSEPETVVASPGQSAWHSLWHDQLSKSRSTLNRTRPLYFPIDFMRFTE